MPERRGNWGGHIGEGEFRTEPEKTSHHPLQCNQVVKKEMNKRTDSENYFISERRLGSIVLLVSGTTQCTVYWCIPSGGVYKTSFFGIISKLILQCNFII